MRTDQSEQGASHDKEEANRQINAWCSPRFDSAIDTNVQRNLTGRQQHPSTQPTNITRTAVVVMPDTARTGTRDVMGGERAANKCRGLSYRLKGWPH